MVTRPLPALHTHLREAERVRLFFPLPARTPVTSGSSFNPTAPQSAGIPPALRQPAVEPAARTELSTRAPSRLPPTKPSMQWVEDPGSVTVRWLRQRTR